MNLFMILFMIIFVIAIYIQKLYTYTMYIVYVYTYIYIMYIYIMYIIYTRSYKWNTSEHHDKLWCWIYSSELDFRIPNVQTNPGLIPYPTGSNWGTGMHMQVVPYRDGKNSW